MVKLRDLLDGQDLKDQMVYIKLPFLENHICLLPKEHKSVLKNSILDSYVSSIDIYTNRIDDYSNRIYITVEEVEADEND